MTLKELLGKQRGTTQVKLTVQDDPTFKIPLFTTYIGNYKAIRKAEVVSYTEEDTSRWVYGDDAHEQPPVFIESKIIHVTVKTLNGVV